MMRPVLIALSVAVLLSRDIAAAERTDFFHQRPWGRVDHFDLFGIGRNLFL